NLGEMTLATDNIRKAYELRARVSERERLEIEAYYDQIATGDLEKARQSYELWAQTYTQNFIPPTNLYFIDMILGQYDKALPKAREALRLEPASGNSYENLAFSYWFLGRLEESQATMAEAHAKNLDTPYLQLLVYLLASKTCSSMWKPIRPPIPVNSPSQGPSLAAQWPRPYMQSRKKRQRFTKPQPLSGKPSW